MPMAIHDEVLSFSNLEFATRAAPSFTWRLVCGAAGLFLALGPGLQPPLSLGALHDLHLHATLFFLKTGHLPQSVPVILRQHSLKMLKISHALRVTWEELLQGETERFKPEAAVVICVYNNSYK